MQEITPNHPPHPTGDPGVADLIQNLQPGGGKEAGNHCSHPRDMVPAQPKFSAEFSSSQGSTGCSAFLQGSNKLFPGEICSVPAIAELCGAGGKAAGHREGVRANPTEPQRNYNESCFSSGLAEFKPNFNLYLSQ